MPLIIAENNSKIGNNFKKRLSPELKVLQDAIKSVYSIMIICAVIKYDLSY